MKNLIFIVLFVPLALNGQINRFHFYSPPVASEEPGTTGEGQVIWYNDLESLSLTSNITYAHIDTIFGVVSEAYGFNDGDNEIIEEDGNQFMRWYMTPGVGGGANNPMVIKEITEVYGEYEEMWCVGYLRFDPNMVDTMSGKMPLGFRGGDESLWGDLPYIDGFNFRKSYNPAQSHRGQLYYAQMSTSSGESTDGWQYAWPTGLDAYIEDEWIHFAIRHVMDPDPPDSTDSFFEYYIEGNLAGRWDHTKTRTADTIHIDKFLCAWFPNNLYEPTIATYVDLDDLGLIIFTNGDSTLTGAERSPDYNAVRFPGVPMGTDTTGWGTFEEP